MFATLPLGKKMVCLRQTKSGDGMTKRSLGLVTAFTPEIIKCEYFTRIIFGIIDPLRSTHYDLRLIMVNREDLRDHKQTLQEHAVEGLMFLTWTIHPKF